MKFFTHVIFVFFLFSFQMAFSSEYKYNFFWYSLPFAIFSIEYSESTEKDFIVKFNIATEGPFKIYRNYSSEITIIRNQHNYPPSWSYELEGIDRGQPEKKSIYYSLEEPPIIKEFIDDRGAEPMIIDSLIDKGSFDPLSVYLDIVKKLRENIDCNGVYSVMDGKRRYSVSVTSITTNQDIPKNYKIENGKIHHCRLELNKEYGNSKTKKKIWPFNGESNYLDIWFSEQLDYEAMRFIVNTPLGKLTANIDSL